MSVLRMTYTSQSVWVFDQIQTHANICSQGSERREPYLYPIHAGLHLQLLHSFPGLGDAGRAVVCDTVLHGAPVTPNAGTKGGTR